MMACGRHPFSGVICGGCYRSVVIRYNKLKKTKAGRVVNLSAAAFRALDKQADSLGLDFNEYLEQCAQALIRKQEKT